MNSKLSFKIKEYKKGNNDIMTDIIIQMNPLIKKYSSKSYFMEYEDAYQEYCLTLINSINNMRNWNNEGNVISYIETSIKNKFCYLFKKYKLNNDVEEEYQLLNLETTSTNEYIDLDFNIDLNEFLYTIKNDNHKKIFYLYIIKNLNDTEISKKLGLSRQYINRKKKELMFEFYNQRFK